MVRTVKNLWVVRSRRKLFTGLAFALGGFMLFYTVLTLLVLEAEIPLKIWFWPAPAVTAVPLPQAPKLRLVTLPLVSLALSVLFLLAGRRKRLPFRREPMPKAQRTLWEVLCAGESFLFALHLFFWQLDRLNYAKGIQGFSPLVALLALTAIPIFAGYAIRKITLAGKGGHL